MSTKIIKDIKTRPLRKNNKKWTRDFYDPILQFANQPYKDKPLGLSPLDKEIYNQ